MNKVTIIGDLALGRYSLLGKTVSEKFGPIKEHIKNSYVVANLECVLADVFKSDGNKLVAPVCLARDMRDSGIDAVSIANNHIYDFGEEGLKSTKNALDVIGINYFNCEEILCTEINNKTIGFISFTYKPPYDGLYKKWAKGIVWSTKQTVDYLIVMIHTGIELFEYPMPRDVKVCREFVDFGADLIVGSHSHCIQASEVYKGKNIFYGIGDFIFDADHPEVWENYWSGEAHPGKFDLEFELDDVSNSLILDVNVGDELKVEVSEYYGQGDINKKDLVLDHINYAYHLPERIKDIERKLFETLKE